MKKSAECRVLSAVICAAGSSARMGGKVRKPYLKLRGRPILSWTLAALARLPELNEVVLVTRPEDRATALNAARLAKLPRRVKIVFADGGPRRQDSVHNGLKATRCDAGLVLIHDAARPFPEFEALKRLCGAALQCGGAILACRVRDTLKKERAGADGSTIERTVSRTGLWQAQTPQAFRRAELLECFERLKRESPEVEMTDDASLFEHFKKSVALVESSASNFKVTQPEDLKIAEAFLKLGVVK